MNTKKMIFNSMGFAYAQGMIEAVKESDIKIKFGGYYIIAPENPSVGSVDVHNWEQ